MRKLIAIPLAGLALLAMTQTARAAVLWQETGNNNSASFSGGVWYNYWNATGQTPGSEDGSIVRSVEVKINSFTGATYPLEIKAVFNLYEGDLNCTGIVQDVTGPGVYTINVLDRDGGADDCALNSTPYNYGWSFSIAPEGTNDTSNSHGSGGYTSVVIANKNAGQTMGSASTDTPYAVWRDTAYSPNYATFLNPTQDETMPTIFNWQIESASEATFSGAIEVAVCPYLTSCERVDVFPGSFVSNSTPRTTSIYTVTPLTPGVKTATVTLRNATSGVAVATSTINFTVVGAGTGAGGGSYNASSTFAERLGVLEDTLEVDCDAFDFWVTLDMFGYDLVPWPNTEDWFPGTYCYVQKGGGYVIRHAVLPHDYALDFFDFALGTISEVFPFNGFFAVKEAALVAASGIETSTATWTLPAIGDLTEAMPIVTSSTLSDFMGTENRDMLFDVERAIMWAGSGLLMLTMIMKL